MKLKTRLNKLFLSIWLFVVAIIALVGIKLVETKQVSATNENVYYSVSSSDFEFDLASKSSSKYSIRLRYIGSDDNVKNLFTSFAPFAFADSSIKTDNGAITLLQAKPAGVPLLNFDFSIESYNQVQPTKIVIPKGQTFTKSEGGFELADDLILEKQGETDTWKIVVEVVSTVSVSTTIGDVTNTEEMRTDATYTFPSVDVIENKTFVGWEINGERYDAGETVKIAECIDEETQSVAIRAVHLDYFLKEGAAIRCDKDMSSSGIRFTAVLNAVDELPTYITGLGVIVMPQDLMGKADFTLENYSGDGQAKNFFAQRADISADTKNTFEFRATIISVLEPNYNRTFAARAYLTMQTREGELQYIWCDGIEKRSVYQVATLAAVDKELSGQQMSIVQTYLNKVVNITYDGNTAKLVSVATTPVIENISASKTNDTITLVLETSETDFPALTMNGIRIKDYSMQAVENGLTITFIYDERGIE